MATAYRLPAPDSSSALHLLMVSRETPVARSDVRTISDTLYPAAAVDRLYCSGLIQPSDSFGLSSL